MGRLIPAGTGLSRYKNLRLTRPATEEAATATSVEEGKQAAEA